MGFYKRFHTQCENLPNGDYRFEEYDEDTEECEVLDSTYKYMDHVRYCPFCGKKLKGNEL